MASSHTYITGANGLVRRRDNNTGGWIDVSAYYFIPWVVKDVMTDPFNPEKVYIVGESMSSQGIQVGILVSTDAGVTWSTPLGDWPKNIYYKEVFVVDELVIWAVGNNSIVVKSTDGGLTFNKTVTNPYGTVYLPNTCVIHALSDQICVVAGNHNYDENTLTANAFLTVDGGILWTTINSGGTLANSTSNPTGITSGIWISPDSSTIIVTTGYTQFKSTNGGLTFTDIGVQMPDSGKHLTWQPTYSATPVFYHTGGDNIQINKSINEGSAWTQERAGESATKIVGAHLYTPLDGYYVSSSKVYLTTDAFLTGVLDFTADQILESVWTGYRARGYELVDCNSENNTFYSDDILLEPYIGQVVKLEIEGVSSNTCWFVNLWTDFPIIDTTVNNIINSYIDCETCNIIAPDELGIPCDITMRVGEPGFTTKHCDPDYVIELECNYATAVYNKYLKLQYGVDICCEKDLDKLKLRHTLLKLGNIYDPDLCPVVCCKICCLPAEDLVLTSTIED